MPDNPVLIVDAIGQPTQEPWPGCSERSPSGRFYCCLPDCHEGYHRALAAEGDADLERWKPRYRYVRETYLSALWFRMKTDHCAWERDVNGDWRIVEMKQ